ncbi:MAG: hypothetical protein BUE48_002175 [Thermomonospora sp. CIF 1]|nr:MAG: hypothetical protein BUE48_002175 [Thermomonospora sp. CIF 1]
MCAISAECRFPCASVHDPWHVQPERECEHLSIVTRTSWPRRWVWTAVPAHRKGTARRMPLRRRADPINRPGAAA